MNKTTVGSWANAPNRNGYAMLLMLVIVIAIAAYMYYLQFGRTEKLPESDSAGNVLPWKEENLLVKDGEAIERPTDKQIDIANGLNCDLNVGIDGEEGGELEFAINPDGSCWGNWHGTFYDSKKVNYDIMQGDCKGNIASSKIYKDQNGEDASKLYLIAKGKYLIAENDFKKGKLQHRGGTFYVTGWVNRDHSVTGKITETATPEGYKTFMWRGSLGAR